MMANEGAIGESSNQEEEEHKWQYDVFLSFRGTDTRHMFTGTLYDALRRKRFRTFMDDVAMKGGDEVSHTQVQAVQSSRMSIVVLSKEFAYSGWCLDELVNILECKRTKNQLVGPVFYDVDPSDVRRQTKTYGEAMARHEARLGEDSEKIHLWRSALSQVANLSGWDFQYSFRNEYELIEKILRWVANNSVPRYDVFISLGKDTRYSFTGFLLKALRCGRLGTLMNVDEFQDLQEQISQSTFKAIAKSRLSIIVFSENYAYSSSCLDELVTILECMKNRKNYMVWPIFYKVEPSDLRHQRNSYGKAMTTHEDLLGQDSEKVQKWRSALSEVANLKGWHLKTGYEYEFIEKIVEIAMKI